jgi:HK97 family phage portal protein
MGLAARLAGALTGAREGWAQRQRGPYNDGWLAVQPGWHVPTETGEVITAGRTLTNPTINACVFTLGNVLGAEQWQIVRDVEGSGHIIDERSPEALALRSLGFTDRQGVVTDVFSMGNAFVRKHSARTGEIGELERLLASNMAILTNDNGQVGFQYHDPYNGRLVRIPAEEIIHLKCRVVQNWPWTGVPPALMGIDAASIAFALQRYKQAALSRAPMLWGVLKTANKIDRSKAGELQERFSQAFYGGPNAGRVPILEQGLDFSPLSIANFESMALEQASRITSLDLCRFFLIPPSLIGETATVNRSTSSTELEIFYRTCLHPNSICITDPIGRGLLRPSMQLAGFRVSMDLDKWILGSGTNLADVASKMAGGPWASPDEARKLFGMAPFRDGLGNILQRPVNMFDAARPAPPGVVEPSPPEQLAASEVLVRDTTKPDPVLERLAGELVALRGLVEESLRRRSAPSVQPLDTSLEEPAPLYTAAFSLPPRPEPPPDDFEAAVDAFMALKPSGDEVDRFLAHRAVLSEQRRAAHLVELERWDAACAALQPPELSVETNPSHDARGSPHGTANPSPDGLAGDVFARLAVELLTARTGEIAKDEIASATRNIVGSLRRELAADRELKAIRAAEAEAGEVAELESFRRHLRAGLP